MENEGCCLKKARSSKLRNFGEAFVGSVLERRRCQILLRLDAAIAGGISNTRVRIHPRLYYWTGNIPAPAYIYSPAFSFSRETPPTFMISGLIFILGIWGPLPTSGPDTPGALSWAEIDSLQAVAPRPMLIWLHTDWCQFCEGMRQKVWPDPAVQAVLAEQYYFLALNGESQEPIVFGGNTWTYRSGGPGRASHDLAEQLGMIAGQLSYPTLVLLSPEYEMLGQWAGFISKKRLLKLLQQAR